jgi:hypothetical protein
LRILGRVQTMKLLMKFPQALCYFLHLGSKTVLSTLFSYRLNSFSSLDVINQVSWPHNNMQNYTSVCLNQCVFRQHTRREKESELRRYKHSSNIIISHWIKFWFVLIPKLATI